MEKTSDCFAFGDGKESCFVEKRVGTFPTHLAVPCSTLQSGCRLRTAPGMPRVKSDRALSTTQMERHKTSCTP